MPLNGKAGCGVAFMLGADVVNAIQIQLADTVVIGTIFVTVINSADIAAIVSAVSL